MKKYFGCILIFVLSFLCSCDVCAQELALHDYYIYFTEPIVGERPVNNVRVLIKSEDGNVVFDDYFDVRWVECEYDFGCSFDDAVNFFRDDYLYGLFFYDEDEDFFNSNYLISEIYYNDILSEPFLNNYFVNPLPGKKYDNTSTGKVRITDISLDSKSTTTVINETPSFKDLDVSFGFGFTEINDYVKYKVTVQNDDTDDYILRDNEMFSESGYVKYELDFDEGTDIIKANNKKTFDITVKYVKEVPDNLLSDGVYTESNTSKLVFSNNDVVNPNTSNKILFILGLLSVIFIGLLFVKVNNKEVKALLIIISCILMLVPVSIKALKEISIGVRADIKVQRTREFCVQEVLSVCRSFTPTERHTYKYYSGMKLYQLFIDYKNINDDVPLIDNTFFAGKVPFTNDLNNFSNFTYDIPVLYSYTDLIVDSSQGCYIKYNGSDEC